MTTDDELSNGKTPKSNKHDNKRSRFDLNRSLSDSDNSDNANERLKSELEQEREKNRDLKFSIGKLQGKLDDLSKQIENLTTVITEMQNEKKQLLELLQNKSPNKNVNREKKPKKKRNKTTQATTSSVSNIQQVNNELNVNERDGKDTAAQSIMPLQMPPNVSHSNDIEMSEGTEHTQQLKTTTPATRLSETAHTDDDESEESENDSSSDDEQVNKKELKHTNTNKRTSKIPPIDIWCDNRGETQNAIQCAVPPNSCLFQRINNNKFRVLPIDTATRLKVIDLAKQQNIQYNTYTPNEEKMMNVLIKGLDHIEDESVIKDALAEKGFVPHKIQKYITGYMRKEKVKSNLWLIVLQPNTDTSELFKIRSIENAIIKFEFLRKPKVIQCRRCQRFNHSASNCFLPYRCVKCTDKHEPGKCKSEMKGNKFKPQCVNCNGNHTANDAAKCDIFKKVIASKESKRKEPSKQNLAKPTIKSTAFAARTTQSYAERVKMNHQHNKVNNSNGTKNIDHFIEKQNTMLSEFMRSIQQMQQQFIKDFNSKNGQRS